MKRSFKPLAIPHAVVMQVAACMALDTSGDAVLLGSALLTPCAVLVERFQRAALVAYRELRHGKRPPRSVVWPERLSLFALMQIADYGPQGAARKVRQRAWHMTRADHNHEWHAWPLGTEVYSPGGEPGVVRRVRFSSPGHTYYRPDRTAQYLIYWQRTRQEIWYYPTELTRSVQPLEDTLHEDPGAVPKTQINRHIPRSRTGRRTAGHAPRDTGGR